MSGSHSQHSLAPGSAAAALPYVVEVGQAASSLEAWLSSHDAELTAVLHRTGAVLMRGFGIDSAESLSAAADALAQRKAPYIDRHSPRSALADGVFTSTDHPADQHISLHNETSFSHQWPRRLAFCCVQPAATGGGTLLADSRRMLARLSRRTLRRFAREGVLYVRNFHDRLGLTWQETFQVHDRDELQEFCRTAAIEAEWMPDGHLRTSQRRHALAQHPDTFELVWFNQAHHFHVRSRGPTAALTLRRLFGEQDLPSHAYYGDGSPIADEVIDEIAAAYEAERSVLNWERGDLLLVDNMLVAHGRESFTGDRKIAVVLSELYTPPAQCGGTARSTASS